MSGEQTRTHEETPTRPIPANTAPGKQPRTNEDRLGPYGGDDGALEHERTEITPSDKLTPDDAETKNATNRRH
jgi:hypothetical protein